MIELDIARHSRLIDPQLHVWGWEIPVYLFLGGMAAGLMIVTSLLALRREERSGAARWLAFASPGLVSIGMGALFLDLAHKAHVWRFYLAFRWSSPMSWGAWILLIVYPVSLLVALAGLDEARGGARRVGRRSARARRRRSRRAGARALACARARTGESLARRRARRVHRHPPLHARRARPLELVAARPALPRLRPLDRRCVPAPLRARRGGAPARDALGPRGDRGGGGGHHPLPRRPVDERARLTPPRGSCSAARSRRSSGASSSSPGSRSRCSSRRSRRACTSARPASRRRSCSRAGSRCAGSWWLRARRDQLRESLTVTGRRRSPLPAAGPRLRCEPHELGGSAGGGAARGPASGRTAVAGATAPPERAVQQVRRAREYHRGDDGVGEPHRHDPARAAGRPGRRGAPSPRRARSGRRTPPRTTSSRRTPAASRSRPPRRACRAARTP